MKKLNSKYKVFYSKNEIKYLYIVSIIGVIFTLLFNMISILEFIDPFSQASGQQQYNTSISSCDYISTIVLSLVFLSLLYFNVKSLILRFRLGRNYIIQIISLVITFTYIIIYSPFFNFILSINAILCIHTFGTLYIFSYLFFNNEVDILPKTVFTTFTAACLILILIQIQFFYFTEKNIYKEKEREILNSIQDLHSRYRLIINNACQLSKNIVDIIYYTNPKITHKQIVKLTKGLLLSNNIFTGIGYGITPEGPWNSKSSSYYFKTSNKQIKINNLYERYKSEGLSYTNCLWYKIPYETKKPYLLKPTQNRAGNMSYTLTYGVPIFEAKSRNKHESIKAIAAFDISIEYIINTLSSYNLDGIQISITNKNGEIIDKTEQTYEVTHLKSIIELGIKEFKNTQRKSIGSIKYNYKTFYYTDNSKRIYAGITSMFNGNNYCIVCIDTTQLFSSLKNVLINRAIIGIIAIVVIFVLIYLTTYANLKPLVAISENFQKIALGDFATNFKVKSSSRQIQYLNLSVREMQVKLRRYFNTVKEKTSIDTEMQFARAAQMNFVPDVGINLDPLKLYWKLKPAREVGGDFCNAFMLNDEKLFISIGDVTGKGIPAAFYTILTLSMERLGAEKMSSMSELVNFISKEIYLFNRKSLTFVSYSGILINIKTGEATYISAGHNPAYVIGENGSLLQTKKASGPFLGILDNIKYKEYKIKLNKNEKIILYTDGITEAKNEHNNFYGYNKLEQCLSDCTNLDAKETVLKILADNEKFKGMQKQYDDICILCYKH